MLDNLKLFTFHYVSISTNNSLARFYSKCIYIPLCIYFNPVLAISLVVPILFTFHYVSISTLQRVGVEVVSIYLHSTMYLFQQRNREHFLRKFPYLHSTMYLFQHAVGFILNLILLFTFHYVSISTISKTTLYRYIDHLHSTMYLFQPPEFGTDFVLLFIYIPLCIYFNSYHTQDRRP